MPEPDANRFFILLPHPSQSLLLLRVEQTGLALPFVQVPDEADILDVNAVNQAMKSQWGATVTTLHSMHCYKKPEPHLALFTLENHDPAWTPPTGLDWFDAEALSVHSFASELHRAVAQTWFDEQNGAPPFLPWWQSGWQADAMAWIETQLNQMGYTLTAPIEQLKSWYFSAVLRVPTASETLYFKAVPPYMRQEVALTQELPGWKLGHFPEPISVDTERLWMFTRDMKGQSLEELRSLEEWGAALCDLAALQQHTTPHPSKLFVMGCPDLRLHCLPERSERLFRTLPELLKGLPEHLNQVEFDRLWEILPTLQSLCDRAAEFNIPATLVHGDFHGINVMRSGGKTLFFDWGDACVSHPFFDAMELLDAEDWLPMDENAYNLLRDRYLRQWTEFEPWERLQELYILLKPLWILAMTFRHEKALIGMEAACPLAARLPHSCALWSTRQQQYWVAIQMRRLLPSLAALNTFPAANGATPESAGNGSN